MRIDELTALFEVIFAEPGAHVRLHYSDSKQLEGLTIVSVNVSELVSFAMSQYQFVFTGSSSLGNGLNKYTFKPLETIKDRKPPAF